MRDKTLHTEHVHKIVQNFTWFNNSCKLQHASCVHACTHTLTIMLRKEALLYLCYIILMIFV